MKKIIALALSVLIGSSVFAMGTVNVGCKTDGSTVVSTIGYDGLVHSFRNTELWLEPHVNLGARFDNGDKAFCYGGGLSFTDTFINTGFLCGFDLDYVRATFSDDSVINSFMITPKVGYKLYNIKLYGGVTKGIFLCTGSDKREEGNIYPWMLSMGIELIF